MKLKEALRILHDSKGRDKSKNFSGFLVCGFEPLHLKTFLEAELQSRFPHYKVSIQSGIYNDLIGNLSRMEKNGVEAAAVILEWSDLDPRLGIRHLGGWRPADMEDIIKSANTWIAAFEKSLLEAAERVPVALCLPSLPLPPISFKPLYQSSSFDTHLQEMLSALASRLASQSNIRLVSPQYLDMTSPMPSRRDVKSDLAFGFPYQLSHASVVAQCFANLMCPPLPKKGLITDLDDTLWHGILGEVGVEGISWDLSHQTQIHGLYQQFLVSLADAGVLIAAASKNNAALVEKAFARCDIILSSERLYPIEAHWGAKSESVSRILEAWNISDNSVLYIDDSMLELEEVKSVHPNIECVLFPRQDSGGVYALLNRLRTSFGKELLTEEDGLRLESLRVAKASQARIASSNGHLDEFLREIESEVTMSLAKHPLDPRALELINKTNQFNLNGARYTESSWKSYLQSPDTFLLSVSYRDKYGRLGKIALVSGQVSEAETLRVQSWVMSCRAFARRIEYQCLAFLFAKFPVDGILFDYQKTEANGPLQELFVELFDSSPYPICQLKRDDFIARCPLLFHKVVEGIPV